MGLKEDICFLTKKMVAINSCSFPMNLDGVRQVLDLVSERLEDRGITYEKNGVVSRLWSNSECLKPKLLLCGHVDVVRASGDDYVCKERGNKLFGRGTGDMKGMVAAMVESYRRLKVENLLAGVALLLTGDEEIGGMNGARYLVDEIGLRPELVFVPDGDWNFDICVSQKAPHHLLFWAKGRGGHASKAYDLINPDRLVTDAVREVQKKLSKARPTNSWESTFEVTQRHTYVEQPEKGKVGIENSANSIPAYAEAVVSWRFPVEKYDFDKNRRWIETVAKRNKVNVVDLHGGGEGCLVDMSDKRVLMWKSIVELVIKRKIGEVRSHGASDARHFFRYPEVKVLLTSARAGGFHSDKEWVDLDSLCELSETVYLFGKNLLE